MKKRFIALFMTFVICLGMAFIPTAAVRDFSEAETKAAALKTLKLFNGYSDTDFGLKDAPNRVQAVILFLRLIGKESEVLAGTWRHPFSDVEQWSDKYIGYAYQKGYINGVSTTVFGSNDKASAAMFLTLLLRSLGYSDKSNADFDWKDPFTLSKKIGLLPASVDTTDFLRADIVLIAWESLFVTMKDGNKELADILISSDVFTWRQLEAAISMVKGGIGLTIDGVKTGTYTCFTDANKTEYEAQKRPSVTLKNDKTFTLTANLGATMSKASGSWYVSKLDNGETAIYLTVSDASSSDISGKIRFTLLNNGDLALEDVGLGKTTVYSVFKYGV